MSELLTQKFLFYESDDGKTKINVIPDADNETIWVTQKSIAEIFNVEIPAISKHISNIFNEGELQRARTVSKMEIVQKEGSRNVKRTVEHYNLDAIISVGYRVNSAQATRFRIWATSVLKEYMIKGFALDDERLKQGNKIFGKDYFSELLERIREIRASERMFYQKITDIFAQCSIDYDKGSASAQDFYATAQNKLHWAIHQHTAAEIIAERADSNQPNMGLTTWKNANKEGKILKSDVSIAKNYLKEEELKELSRVVTMYLDFAENMANKNRSMTMLEWVGKLDDFLQFNEYDILENAGKISADTAKKLAEKQYSKFRGIQDIEYKSDFDRLVENSKKK